MQQCCGSPRGSRGWASCAAPCVTTAASNQTTYLKANIPFPPNLAPFSTKPVFPYSSLKPEQPPPSTSERAPRLLWSHTASSPGQHTAGPDELQIQGESGHQESFPFPTSTAWPEQEGTAAFRAQSGMLWQERLAVRSRVPARSRIRSQSGRCARRTAVGERRASGAGGRR
jgi:hypothetical protein